MEAATETVDREAYDVIRSGGAGFYESPRGLIAVWGKEAIPFLDGMITNDMKTLADGAQMLAAFPNVQGRLLAVVRVLRNGDRFLLETEEATREKLFQNLFRFTFAGDFFVEDLSDRYRHLAVFNMSERPSGMMVFHSNPFDDCFIPIETFDEFRSECTLNKAIGISPELFETLRIESGIPRVGVDMDETTIVAELGLEDLISYTKGCYVGQEIIARIRFHR